MRRYLMISPHFVPSARVGAKRALHHARHTPGLGWEPVVVTLPVWMLRDAALDAVVPEVPIHRVLRAGPAAWLEDARGRPKGGERAPMRFYGASEPGRSLLPYDRLTKYLLWSYPRVCRIARATRCEVVYVNAPPVSGSLLGARVAARLKLPLVLDLRDPWTLDRGYRAAWTPLAARVAERTERRLLACADRVVFNTEAALEAHRNAYPDLAGRSTFIRNCYDPDLYDPLPPPPRRDAPFTVAYYGHLRASSVGTAAVLFEGFRRFASARALSPADARLVLFGEHTTADDRALEEHGAAEHVRFHPWVPFTRSRAVLGRAHVLCDVAGPTRLLQIHAKIFDYLAAGRPILSLSKNPEVDRLLRDTGTGRCVAQDPAAVAGALDRLYVARHDPFRPAGDLSDYQAPAAARALVEVLARAAAQGEGASPRASASIIAAMARK